MLSTLDTFAAMYHHPKMLDIVQSDVFKRWLGRLKNRSGKARILGRIERMRGGNLGDHKPVGDVLEARVHVGPGYRLYFIKDGEKIVVLLCGGNKSSQHADIKKACKIADKWRQT